jgi:Protein of unknown function (DUF1153)
VSLILPPMNEMPALFDLTQADLVPPGGSRIGPARAELPPPDTKRWVVRRKAVVVAAVRSGAISLKEACRRYNLSVEEFMTWQRAIESHGIPGLRVTRIQIYRGAPPSRIGK